MKATYPPGWAGLSHPDVRAELLSYLTEAANPMAFSDTPSVEFLVHFILDDHDFEANPSAQVGSTLADLDEAESLANFAKTLAVAIGPRSRSLSALTIKDWEAVATAAREAQAKLSKLGLPPF